MKLALLAHLLEPTIVMMGKGQLTGYPGETLRRPWMNPQTHQDVEEEADAVEGSE